jgi:hypothetical protein
MAVGLVLVMVLVVLVVLVALVMVSLVPLGKDLQYNRPHRRHHHSMALQRPNAGKGRNRREAYVGHMRSRNQPPR